MAGLEKIDDGLSGGMRDFDNETAGLLNTKSWLSSLSSLSKPFIKIKELVEVVNLFVNDKEKMEEVFRWIDGRSYEEIIVLIFGFVQREQIEFISKNILEVSLK